MSNTGNIRSAIALLPEIRNGHAVNELSEQIHEATQAACDHGKAAEVTLTIRIKPISKNKHVEPAMSFTAEVSSKLPKPDPEETLFFVSQDGQPTRQPSRNENLPFTVAGKDESKTGTED